MDYHVLMTTAMRLLYPFKLHKLAKITKIISNSIASIWIFDNILATVRIKSSENVTQKFI